MLLNRIEVSSEKSTFSIGYQAENEVTLVAFDVRDWLTDCDGQVQLVVQRDCDLDPYAVPVRIENGFAEWLVTETDTACRKGKAQLQYFCGAQIAKKQIYTFWAKSSLGPSHVERPPWDNWFDTILQAGSDAQQAATQSQEAAKKAKASETAAKDSQVAAKTSEEHAAQKALLTQKDAEQSGLNAQSAGNSAGDAARSAAAASKSEEVAGRSAQAAETSKTAAETAAANAGTSAGAAAKHEEAALAAADRAEQAAQQAAGIIDDAAIVTDKTWSSLNIIKQTADRLAPPFRQKGPVVQGELVADYPMTVKSYIEPIQEGSGDPSPNNVRPIHGVTELKAVKCGTNLCCVSFGTAPIIKIKLDVLIPPGDYIVSGKTQTSSPNAKYVGFLALRGNINVSREAVRLSTKGERKSGVLRILKPADTVWIYSHDNVFVESKKYVASAEELQIELGTVATPYEPYHGETYTQMLPEEVYGGVYNWDTGELVVTWKGRKFTGAEPEWKERNYTYGKRFFINCVGIESLIDINPKAFTTDKFKSLIANWNQPDKWTVGVSSAGDFYFACDETITSVAGWKEWLINNGGVTLVYRSKPESIQLPKHLILSNPNITTVYGNTAEVEVIARKDPNTEREAMEKRIAALSSAALKR